MIELINMHLSDQPTKYQSKEIVVNECLSVQLSSKRRPNILREGKTSSPSKVNNSILIKKKLD